MFAKPGAVTAWLYCCLAGLLFAPGKSRAQHDLNMEWPSCWYANTVNPTFSSFYPDTASINQLLYIADSALWGHFPDSSRQLSALALQQSRQIGYRSGMAHALNTIGACYQQEGNHDSAILFFKKALPYTETMANRRNLYKLYENMATSYFSQGKYEQVLESFYHSLESIQGKPKQFTYSDSMFAYNNIGLVWERLGGAEQAFHALNIARSIAERNRDTTLIAYIYTRIGEAYMLRNDNARAETYYIKGLETARKHKQIRPQIEVLNTLSHLYMDEQKPVEAMSSTQEALRLLQLQPGAYEYDQLHTQHNLGRIYLYEKKYDQAAAILLPTFEKAIRQGQKELIPHMEPDIAALYASMGNYRQAYEHMHHYALQKDTIFEQERSKSLDLWIKSKMDEKDKAMLAQKLQITQQQNKLQTKNFWIGGTILGSILLLSISIIIIRNYRQKQRLQQSTILQLQQEQEINQLKAQVRGEEQERNRLARELHDGIASQLWAIKLNVDGLQNSNHLSGDQRQGLQSIYRQLEDTTQEVRKTAHNLMPDLLLEEGLATALASLCERIKKQTDLEVDFMEYGVIPRMDEEIELSLYRMVQELIQNMLKHAASATQLLVQLSCMDSLLNITVEDNGPGFSKEEVQTGQGMGLRYIEKRVHTLHGHMDLQSVKGKGTTVYLEFDIQHLL